MPEWSLWQLLADQCQVFHYHSQPQSGATRKETERDRESKASLAWPPFGPHQSTSSWHLICPSYVAWWPFRCTQRLVPRKLLPTCATMVGVGPFTFFRSSDGRCTLSLASSTSFSWCPTLAVSKWSFPSPPLTSSFTYCTLHSTSQLPPLTQLTTMCWVVIVSRKESWSLASLTVPPTNTSLRISFVTSASRKWPASQSTAVSAISVSQILTITANGSTTVSVERTTGKWFSLVY